MRKMKASNSLTIKGILLSILLVFMTSALVFSHSMPLTDSAAAGATSHAVHVMDRTADGNDTSHAMYQSCVISCTLSDDSDADFALILALDWRNLKIRHRDQDAVTPYGPDMPDRPPQSI